VRRGHAHLDRVSAVAGVGFALTALWMPVFSQQWFVAAWAIIVGALTCLLHCAAVLSRMHHARPGQILLAWLPLSLHAGWLSLATFLNTAQLIVAKQWLSTAVQLPWSLALFTGAATLLLLANLRMRGNLAYVAAAMWGLVAVYVAQSRSPMAGAGVTAVVALALALALVVQYAWLRRRATARGTAPA
jgi:hypothetical protein